MRLGAYLHFYLAYLLVALVAVWLYRLEIDKAHQQLSHLVDKHSAVLAEQMEASFASVYSLAEYYNYSHHVDEPEFQAMGKSILSRSPALLNLAWMERVDFDQKQDYLLRQKQLGRSVVMTEFSPPLAGTQQLAERPVYYPISLITPAENFRWALGRDMASPSAGGRADALLEAVKTGKPVMSAPQQLLVEGSGAWLFVPIYPYLSGQGDRESGVVGGLFYYTFLLNGAGLNQLVNDFAISIIDTQHPQQPLLNTPVADQRELAHDYFVQSAIDSGLSRSWILEMTPAKHYVRALVSYRFLLVPLVLCFLIVLLQYIFRYREKREERINQLVARKTEQLNEANQMLQQLAATDALTGIANRRSFDERLEAEYMRAKRNHSSLALILMDIDYFKNYNDFYGHKAGDQCLQDFVDAIKPCLQRASDSFARIGGEEFAAIIADPENPEILIEQMFKALRGKAIPHAKSSCSEFVSFSLGCFIATPSDRVSVDQFYTSADKALYKAKSEGRNTYRLVHLESGQLIEPALFE
jgi:diguanylate cyclase (GGDEF)-like protein